MDLGLGNLAELKGHLLADALAAQATYDTVIAAIGRGTAAAFDRFCNRKFARLAGAQDSFSGDRTNFCVARFPVETITTVEIRDDMVGGWQAQNLNDVILQRDDGCGLVKFGFVVGIELTQVRITYTGGYWYDTTEDSTGVQPGAATAVPSDLKLAWYLQCQEIWNSRDKLGAGISLKATDQVKMDGLDLIPQVKTILRGFVRFQMT